MPDRGEHSRQLRRESNLRVAAPAVQNHRPIDLRAVHTTPKQMVMTDLTMPLSPPKRVSLVGALSGTGGRGVDMERVEMRLGCSNGNPETTTRSVPTG